MKRWKKSLPRKKRKSLLVKGCSDYLTLLCNTKLPPVSFFEVPETRIDVEVPKITTDLGKELHFVKLPNFLSVDCRPFDVDTYEDEIEDEDSLDEEGRARLKLKVENTIRWRQAFDKDGNAVKESNARIVR